MRAIWAAVGIDRVATQDLSGGGRCVLARMALLPELGGGRDARPARMTSELLDLVLSTDPDDGTSSTPLDSPSAPIMTSARGVSAAG